METKYVALINILLESESNILSAGELSKLLGVSPRTVLRYISFLNSADDNESFRIIPVKSRGFRLKVIDPDKFSDFLVHRSSPLLSMDASDREILLMIGLCEPSVQKLEEKANYSLGSLARLIAQINERLSARFIKIARLNNRYYLTGNEIQARNFLQFLCTEQKNNGFYFSNMLTVQWNQFKNMLHKEDPLIKQELARFLFISWIRASNDHQVDFTPIIHEMYESSSSENTTAKNIISFERLNCEKVISTDELILTALALHTQRSEVQYNELLNTIVPILKNILKQNDKKYGTEFSEDESLINALACHLSGNIADYLLSRKHDNQLLDQIRLNYTNEHLYALELANCLSEMFGLQISDDDVGYFTLHFASSTIRSRKSNSTPAIILYSHSFSSAQLLKSKIEEEIPALKILGIQKAEASATLDHLEKIGLLIAVEKVLKSKRIIYVSPFVNEDDKSKIKKEIIRRKGLGPFLKLCHKENFFILTGLQGKRKVLTELSNRLICSGYLTAMEGENLLQRENLTSTEIALNTAFPHCLINSPSFLAIAVLKQPVFWGKSYVSLILLMGINNQESTNQDAIRYLFDSLTSDKIRRLLDSESFAEFIEILGE